MRAGHDRQLPPLLCILCKMNSGGNHSEGPEAYLAMQAKSLAWYCARTKPKHEHIAAANVHKQIGLEVFLPQLRIERVTKRGMARVVEPLFPCYLFIRCVIEQHLDEIRYTNGISSLVHFSDRIPSVPTTVVEELRESFQPGQPLIVDDVLPTGAEIVLSGGAFAGMSANVLRVMPSRQRVEVLLDMLGRPTAVEVDRNLVVWEGNSVAGRMPWLAASSREMAVRV
jgi:transcriptional antiterminator RfaH